MMARLRRWEPWRAQERLETSAPGRVLLSLVAVVLVVSIAAWNLPQGDTGLRHSAMRFSQPIMFALGLDQDWGVFAPPRLSTIALSARITYADGSREEWRPPTSTGALVGAYRDYRWGKLSENELQSSNALVLWDPLVRWLAREHRHAGRRPSSIELISSTYPLYPLIPGHPAAGQPRAGRGPWSQSTLLTYAVPATPGQSP